MALLLQICTWHSHNLAISAVTSERRSLSAALHLTAPQTYQVDRCYRERSEALFRPYQRYCNRQVYLIERVGPQAESVFTDINRALSDEGWSQDTNTFGASGRPILWPEREAFNIARDSQIDYQAMRSPKSTCTLVYLPRGAAQAAEFGGTMYGPLAEALKADGVGNGAAVAVIFEQPYWTPRQVLGL